MKRIFLVLMVFGISLLSCYAQNTPVKVIFDSDMALDSEEITPFAKLHLVN